MDRLQALDGLHVHLQEQLVTLTYRVFADDKGEPGELVAFVRDKKWAFKAKVTVYADEDRTSPLAILESRKAPGLLHGHAITTTDGETVIGTLGLQLSKSWAKTTWLVRPPHRAEITVREDDSRFAALRRAWKLVQPDWLELPFLFKYHFDLIQDDTVIGTVEKKKHLEEQYAIRIYDNDLDRLLLVALAIVLDLKQYRAT